jgi:hypothetical protein
VHGRNAAWFHLQLGVHETTSSSFFVSRSAAVECGERGMTSIRQRRIKKHTLSWIPQFRDSARDCCACPQKTEFTVQDAYRLGGKPRRVVQIGSATGNHTYLAMSSPADPQLRAKQDTSLGGGDESISPRPARSLDVRTTVDGSASGQVWVARAVTERLARDLRASMFQRCRIPDGGFGTCRALCKGALPLPKHYCNPP